MVSVVIVTYNAESTLQRCLDSIYALPNVRPKLIVIDGKSTDGTLAILQKNKLKIDYWVSEPDLGIYDAMNKGIAAVKTKWVYFLGADDQLLPSFQELVLELKDQNKVYYAGVIYKEKVFSAKISTYRQAKSGIFHQSIIYPTALFKTHTYNEKYKIAADYALNMEIHKDQNYQFVFKDFVIAHYNHTGVSAHKIDEVFEEDKSQLILKNFGWKIWIRYIFRIFKRDLLARK